MVMRWRQGVTVSGAIVVCGACIVASSTCSFLIALVMDSPSPSCILPVAPPLLWQTGPQTPDACRHSPYSLAPGTPCCGGSRGRPQMLEPWALPGSIPCCDHGPDDKQMAVHLFLKLFRLVYAFFAESLPTLLIISYK